MHGDEHLTNAQSAIIQANESDVIGVSVISVWEVAKLVQYNRLELPSSLPEWFDDALSYPGIRLFSLSPEIAIECTQLPGQFHRDPADQMIVATAGLCNCALLSSDTRILKYQHVQTVILDSMRRTRSTS